MVSCYSLIYATKTEQTILAPVFDISLETQQSISKMQWFMVKSSNECIRHVNHDDNDDNNDDDDDQLKT